MLPIMRIEIADGIGKDDALGNRTDTKVEKGDATGIEAVIARNVKLSESNISELSDSISILAVSYFLLYTSLSFILSVSLEALMT